jgi:mannose-6-phosphate isomerase-like protein (cupin superfamily)
MHHHANAIGVEIAHAFSLRRMAFAPAVRMALKHLRFGKGFSVALSNARAQAATMVIAPGDCEGGPDNRHRGADQWLFVLSGRGVAIVGRKRHPLRTGTLLLIERGATHEIRNTGRTPLKTLNLYMPPAYTKAGDELPRGRS